MLWATNLVYSRITCCDACISFLCCFEVSEEVVVRIIAFVFREQFIGMSRSIGHVWLYALQETLELRLTETDSCEML